MAENLKFRAEAQLAAAETTLGSAISAEAKQQAEGAKAQAAARPGRPTYPAIEVMLTICPWRLSRMYGNTAFIIATAPKTLTSNWRLNSSNEDSSRVPS